MVKATRGDKKLVIDILATSFEGNLSVNYVVKNDGNKKKR